MMVHINTSSNKWQYSQEKQPGGHSTSKARIMMPTRKPVIPS
jgi:hypothetical protein